MNIAFVEGGRFFHRIVFLQVPWNIKGIIKNVLLPSTFEESEWVFDVKFIRTCAVIANLHCDPQKIEHAP